MYPRLGHPFSQLPILLIVWSLVLGLPAQTAGTPQAGSESTQATVQAGEEMSQEKADLSARLVKVDEALASLSDKETTKKALLKAQKSAIEEGLAEIQRYRDLQLERIGKPWAHPLLDPPQDKDFVLSPGKSLYLMSLKEREDEEARLKRLRRLIENELQALEERQASLLELQRGFEAELAQAQSRNESVLAKERQESEAELARIDKELTATPKPEGDLLESLSLQRQALTLKLKTLDRERRRRKDWQDWLEDARKRIQEAISKIQDGLHKKYLDQKLAVDRRLSELKVYQLEVVDLPPTPALEAAERAAIVQILEALRLRVERLIGETAKTQSLQRKLEGERIRVQADVGQAQALVTKVIEGTAPKEGESSSIRSFRLQMGIKAVEREIDHKILEALTWRGLFAEKRRLARQLDTLQLEIEDIRDRAHLAIEKAAPGFLDRIGEEALRYIDGWIAKEEKESRSLLTSSESTLEDLLTIQRLLDDRRELLQSAIQTLESRGILLQDPQRLILRGQGFKGFFIEMGSVFRHLWALPGELWDAATHEDLDGNPRFWPPIIAFLLLCCAGLGAFFLRRKARGMQQEVLGQEQPARALIFRLTVTGWIYRLLPWAAVALVLLLGATLFSPASQEQRLATATGKFFLFASFWIVTSRVFLRPANPRLRFFVIQDDHARRLYRIVSFGLVFWLLGLIGQMMGALLSGYQGRIFEAALLALRDGGLLVMAFLFFARRSFLIDLFPSPDEGGLRFLQAFVLFALWPIRIFLVISLGAWLMTWYDLAHALGLWIIGGFGSLLVAVTFHQILRHEINDRFFLDRYRVDEDSLADLSDDEREALLTDRNKVARLVSSFIEILEFLLSIFLFLAIAAWFYGIDGAGIERLLDTSLWGSSVTHDLVTLGNLLAFLLAVFLTLALSKRAGPTIDYILEKRTVIDRGMRYTMGTLGGYVVFILGMAIAFTQLSIGFAQVSWILAALGVGIGFGLQDIVSNFFSGLILLFERPLRVGDVVRVGETLGEVKKITIRSTTVTSFDNIDVIVPNKDFIASSITNWTASDRDMRSTIDVGVAYGSDLKQVRQVLLETVCKHGRVFKKPAPSVFIKSFGDSSIDFAVVYWTLLDYKRGTFSDLHFAIEAAFGREGIEIPFPQRDVNLKLGEELPVVLRKEEPDAAIAPEGPAGPGALDAAARAKGKRDDDREIRRMSAKTEASEEIEAGGDVDGGGDADL